MKKKALALVALLVCCCMALTGCLSTEGLKKVPQGQRIEGLNFAEEVPQFPSDGSVKNQLMLQATDIRTSETMEGQREAYDEFMRDAFVYVVGPYNFTLYCGQDGQSMSVYYENMINHMNTFLSEWEPTAWQAVKESPHAAQLQADIGTLHTTAETIRSIYPTGDESTAANLQSMYNARDALAEGMAEGYADSDLEMLLDDVFATRESVADGIGYDTYLQFVIEKREKMPYNTENLLKLAELVRVNLAPELRKIAVSADFTQLTAEEWNDALPALAQRFPAYAEDLKYVMETGAFTVESTEETRSSHYAYPLYQYDMSAGKSKLAGDEDDALHVLRGLGLAARNMALPQEQWSLSEITAYDQVQENAFAARALAELDAVYGEEASAVTQRMLYLMAKDVCEAAMQLELLNALYRNPIMAQTEREELAQELAQAYGLDGVTLEGILESEEDILAGTAQCAGRMLGGLYGLTLYDLTVTDEAAADAVLEATLSVYNAANPIAAGYAAGLSNPFSGDGIKDIAWKLSTTELLGCD